MPEIIKGFVLRKFRGAPVKTRAETAQTMAISEVHEKSSESHEKFMRKS